MSYLDIEGPSPLSILLRGKNVTKYVNGLLFSPDKTKVVMVRKNRPDWQAGALNAVGGKIENKETAYHAMCREFKEEANIDIDDWSAFVTLKGDDFELYCFRAISEHYDQVKTMTDENIEIHDVADLLSAKEKMINNLFWILPMALDENIAFPVEVKYNC